MFSIKNFKALFISNSIVALGIAVCAAIFIIMGSMSPTAAVSASAPSNVSVWDRIAKCESGGNWKINTGNGYYGGLQFKLSTWRAYGGKGYPHKASKNEQIRIANKVRKAQGGYGAWGSCGRRS